MNSEYQLQQHQHRLELHTLSGEFNPLYIDFVAGKAAHRRQQPGKELLAKAVGFRATTPPTIIDATAGLGQDAFVLASLGCSVILIERCEMLHALLADALERAHQHPDTAAIAARMQLHYGSAQEWLPQFMADVVYLDPMYPSRDKTALVKKEMRILRDLVGDNEDASEVLAIARGSAQKRVVVKRPRLGEYLAEQKPDFCYTSKQCRFDVYV